MSIKSNVSLFFGVLILFLLSHCSGGGNGETTTLPPPTGASSTPVVQQPTTVPLNQFERNIYITVRNASAPVTPDPAYNIYRDFSIKSVDPVAQMSGGQANYSSITLMTGKALLALSRSGIAVTASKVSGAGIGTVLQVHDIKSPNSLFSNIDIFSDSQPFLFMKGHMKAIINDTGSTIAFMTLDSSGLQGVHVIQIDPSNGQKLLENQLPLKSIIPS
ncbi:MAG: hypothetical protein HYS98_08635, partial [Deltaproteobacteria bacterium]|nr:hypothetical protein [Deltaproteobacteria bacterium]